MMGKELGEALDEFTLLLNFSNPVVKKVRKMKDDGRADDARLLAEQIYDLALLTHKSFGKEQMEAFLERSNKILDMVGRE